MYKRSVYQFIGLIISVPNIVMAVESKSIREMIDQKIDQTIETIDKEKKSSVQIQKMYQLKVDLKSTYQGKKEYEGPADELYMTQTLAVFDVIPSKNFDLKKCDQYKNNLLAQFEPKAPGSKPSVNYLVKPFSILEKICRSR